MVATGAITYVDNYSANIMEANGNDTAMDQG